jgi:NADH-quinone oxidoreductase subunit J
MSLPLLLFFIFAAVSVAGAVLLIVAREPIHSALALILVMVALAALYLMLGAEFIAAVQIIVYAGAIMVLFVFVIMLLNAGVEERTDRSKIAKFAGLPLGIFLLLWLGHWMAHSAVGATAAGGAVATNAAYAGTAIANNTGAFSTRALSEELFRTYLFPFEATSILILIAILGALVLARRGE